MRVLYGDFDLSAAFVRDSVPGMSRPYRIVASIPSGMRFLRRL